MFLLNETLIEKCVAYLILYKPHSKTKDDLLLVGFVYFERKFTKSLKTPNNIMSDL